MEGVKAYCNDFQQRIASCMFTIVDILQEENKAMVEWTAQLTYRKDATVAGFTLARPFTVALRGINKFEFNKDKIRCLRIYHETTTVMHLVKEHAQ